MLIFRPLYADEIPILYTNTTCEFRHLSPTKPLKAIADDSHRLKSQKNNFRIIMYQGLKSSTHL